MHLRTRLLLGLGAIAIAFGVTGYLVATTQQRYLTEQLDRELQQSMPAAMRVLGAQTGPLPPDQGAALSKLYVGHLDADGVLTTIVEGSTTTTGTPDVGVADAIAHSGPGSHDPFTVDGVGSPTETSGGRGAPDASASARAIREIAARTFCRVASE